MHASFFVRTNGKLTAFPFDDILYVAARSNYSEIVTTKKKFLVYVALGSLESHLPANLFCRVHRSYIVAVHKISSFDHQEIEIGGEKLSINKAGFDSIIQRVLVIPNESDNKPKKRLHGIILEDSFKHQQVQTQ